MQKSNMTFAWWNTSLSHFKKQASSKQQQFVCSLIEIFIHAFNIDFIALGEMSESDIQYIRSNCNIDNHQIESGIFSVGRAQFDLCYIFNKNKIDILDIYKIVTTKGNNTFKVAQKLDVIVKDSSSPFHIFTSHWPSRLWCHEDSSDRHYLGMRLRDSIDEILQKDDQNPHILLLGDYNDEPFNKSLSEHVMATRDKSLVYKHKHLMYNPFWNYLGSRFETDQIFGTYYYNSGKITKWHTFDQIIFSHAFYQCKRVEIERIKKQHIKHKRLYRVVDELERNI